MQVTARGFFLFQMSVSFLAIATRAETSLCSQSGFRCVGRSLYQFCMAPPDSYIFTCDPGLVCSTADPSGNLCIEEPPACVTQGAFRIDGSCNRYYFCIHNGYSLIQHIGHCAAGFEFSMSMMQCVFPAIAGCSLPLPTTPLPTTTEEITTLDNNESSPGSLTTPSSETEITTPPPSFKCPSSGLHADPSSCRSFYQCSRTPNSTTLFAVKQKCPLYLPHFNTKRRICWFFNDKC